MNAITYWTRHWLLFAFFALATGIYVDEPLLYDNFPSDFMWAAATSAYQIEGGWDADGNLENVVIWNKKLL